MLLDQTISLGSLPIFATSINITYLTIGYLVDIDSALDAIFVNHG